MDIEGLCLRCRRDNHILKECRTEKSNLKCSGCSKTSHISKICIRTLLDKKSKSKQKPTNYVLDETAYNQYGIQHIVDIYQSTTTDTECYHTHINIEGKSIKFEVDSGSGYTFLPRDQFAKLKIDTPLQPVKIGFRSYTQNVFVPDGKIKVNMNYNSKAIQDEIYIVSEEYTALVGRIWIRRLGISLNEIDDTQLKHQHTLLKATIKITKL